MIPNVIHFIWMTKEAGRSDDPLTDEVKVQLMNWHQNASNFAVRCWSWEDFVELMSNDGDREVVELIRTCRMYAMRSDIMRLCIIHKLGGVWSDIKNKPARDLRHELPMDQPLFIGEHWPLPHKSDTNGFYANGFFGAVGGNKFIGSALDYALGRVRDRDESDSIASLTGGGVFTRLAKRPEQEIPFPIKADRVWKYLIQRTPMNYNKGEMHWSVRQKSELLYC